MALGVGIEGYPPDTADVVACAEKFPPRAMFPRREQELSRLVAEAVSDENAFHRAQVWHEDQLARGIEAVKRQISAGKPPDLDETIDSLLRREQQMARTLAPYMKQAKRALRDLKRVSPARRDALSPIYRQYIDTACRILEALRDARWQLMALRAESTHKQGPTFHNPKELKRHFRS